MATYGLRDHELHPCKFLDHKHSLHIIDTKHNPPLDRTVIPVHPEWVELFDLRNERHKDFTSLKQTISQWLHVERKKLKDVPNWKPYALRHAFAGRLWKLGGATLDIYTAARLIGHTASVYEKT